MRSMLKKLSTGGGNNFDFRMGVGGSASESGEITIGVNFRKIKSSPPGGIVLISFWKCDSSIYLDFQLYYLDIQAISTLLCLLLVLDV